MAHAIRLVGSLKHVESHSLCSFVLHMSQIRGCSVLSLQTHMQLLLVWCKCHAYTVTWPLQPGILSDCSVEHFLSSSAYTDTVTCLQSHTATTSSKQPRKNLLVTLSSAEVHSCDTCTIAVNVHYAVCFIRIQERLILSALLSYTYARHAPFV